MSSPRNVVLSLGIITLLTGCSLQQGPSPVRPVVEAAERIDPVLQARIDAVTAGFHGDVGVYVRHLGTGAAAMVAPDDTFPTASMVKVPLLITLFDQARQGRLHLDSTYMLTDSTIIQNDGDDVFAPMGVGSRVQLGKLAYLMMALSDNTASVWIQTLIGGSGVANEWLAANGYTITRDNSRFAERRPFHRIWGWGMTSPREIASLLVRIRSGRAVSPEASEQMYSLMTRAFFTEEALSSIPPWVLAASKSGAVNRSRSEVLLVHSPAGEYVLAVITKNNQDERWTHDNEAHRLIRDVSWATWNHFNPDDTWRPLRMRTRGAGAMPAAGR